jgi:heme A synthase
MGQIAKLSRFAKYAWFVLACNVVVILWGVFLRASKSGDGCGQHWITCHGEFIPSAPELKTVIEFSHRATSALAGLLIIALLLWAILRWRTEQSESSLFGLKVAFAALIFVIIEGALGAGLVLTGNTAETLTPARPFWMAAHLLNTLILLAVLATNAWSASTGQTIKILGWTRIRSHIVVGAMVVFLIGASGSVAALCNMIFPSATLQEGFLKDISPTSHVLLKIRPFHPIIAVAGSVALFFWFGWIQKTFADKRVRRLSRLLSALIVVQLVFGAVTLLSLSPILMQLGHLLLADGIWLSFIILSLTLVRYEQAKK